MAPHINSKRIHTFKTTMGMGAMEVTFLAVFYLRSNTTTNLHLNCQVSFIKHRSFLVSDVCNVTVYAQRHTCIAFFELVNRSG